MIRKTGELIWVETSGQPVFTSDGLYIGFRTSTNDISQLKNIEYALRESEEKYRDLFQFMDEGIIRTDNLGSITLANNAIARILEYNTPEELISVNIAETYPADKREQMSKELRISHQLNNFEIFTKTKQGKEIYTLCHIKEIHNKHGESIGREAIIRDITESKEIELALRESEEKYKDLFQFMEEGLIRTDNFGKITIANNAVARIFGYNSPDDLIGIHITEIYPAETRERMSEELIRSHRLYNYEILTKTRQGKEIYVLCHIKEIYNKKGVLIGREASVRDITELKEIELALRKSEIELKEANSTKDKFISILAHDLRNPLGNFREVTKLLTESFYEFSEEEKLDFLNLITESSKNVYTLLENLLEWSRLQRNAIVYQPQLLNLNHIANDVCNLLKLSASKKNITFENNVSANISLYADFYMLNTTIRNLVSNAIKYTNENGKIIIDALPYDNNYIQVLIKDNGVGMTKDIKDKLFKIDTHISIRGTNDEPGTGLGLILCKEFVEKQDGKIWVESDVEIGSTFYFTIPFNV